MNIFIVTAGEHYEGLRGQWVFADVAPARAKYKEFLAKGALAHIGADYVTLAGPFAPGDNVLITVGKVLAYHDPQREAEEAAAYKARLAKAKAKAKRKATKPTDGYAAMRMRDGG